MLGDLINRLKQLGEKKAMILMYHQVCERNSDPWQLAVSPANFEMQLNWLKKKFDVISVEELVYMLIKNRLRKNLVAITFDDGFADNYTNAAPLLEWYRLPATFYFATNPLRNPRLYWWDELELILFHANNLPLYLDIKVGEDFVHHHFRRHHRLTPKSILEISKWVYGTPFNNERIDLYLKLWRKMQPLSSTEQYKILDDLKAWAGIDKITWTKGSVMCEHQLKAMGQNSLFSIGAHSVNHSMLAMQPRDVQTFEISESKKTIEKLIGKKITGFAYPYGNYSDVTRSLIAQAGFQYAVSTESKVISSDADYFSLPRVQVKNWSVNEFSFQLDQMIN